jgi:hypothetical protein
MNIESFICELEERVEISENGANIGGFPCGVVRGVILLLV